MRELAPAARGLFHFFDCHVPKAMEPKYLDDGNKIASRRANISSPDAPVLKLGKESLTFFY
jgi:hypothetical protein